MGSQNAGTETGDAQVGECPRAVGGDVGIETVDYQVGGCSCVVGT